MHQHQLINRFGQPEDAEHRRKLVERNQTLIDQPQVIVEVRILNEIPNASLNEFARQLDVTHQSDVEKRLHIARMAAHEFGQVEPHQGVRSAANWQRVVATHDAVTIT